LVDSPNIAVIDFTKPNQNTYMRGRIDRAGMNATATGTPTYLFYRIDINPMKKIGKRTTNKMNKNKAPNPKFNRKRVKDGWPR
jgi:hypothetical protein